MERFSTHVAAILMEEGFTVNFRKTRVMRQGVRQRLVGLVANERPNVMRTEFDRLQGDPDELRETWPGEPESRRASTIPIASRRPHEIRGER